MDYNSQIIVWSYFTLQEVEEYLCYCPKKKARVLKYLAMQAHPDLIKVAAAGDLESVQYLLSLGKVPTVAALEWAIRSGSLPVFETLYNIDNKNTSNKWSFNSSSDTKLQLSCVAAESGQLEILKYLNPKAQKKEYLETILNAAVIGNHLEIVQYLLDLKIRPNHYTFTLALFKPEIKKLLYQYN